MGSFIIIDKITNNTMGAGMILRKCDNTTKQIPNEYSQFEIEFNALIRKHFPNWESKEIL